MCGRDIFLTASKMEVLMQMVFMVNCSCWIVLSAAKKETGNGREIMCGCSHKQDGDVIRADALTLASSALGKDTRTKVYLPTGY